MLKKTFYLPMNLQFFADAGDEGASEASESSEESQEQQSSERTYTQDEVNEIVKKRLERAKRSQEQKVKSARDEATKLAKMNAGQKQEYKIKQLEQEANDAKAKLARYEMRATARQQLADGGFAGASDQVLDMIVTDKAETTQENADAFLKLVESIKKQVRQDLLKGSTPRSSGKPVKPKTADDLLKLSQDERVRLQHEDPIGYAKAFKS